MTRPSLFPLLLLGVVACGDPAPGENEIERQWTLDPTPHLQIGEVDGDERYLFGRLFGGELTADGSIVVLDLVSQSLKKYSAEGEFLTEMGRKGEGPGEFTYISNLWLADGDVVTAFDGLARRMTRFNARGELSSVVPIVTPSPGPFAVGEFSDGTLALGWHDRADEADAEGVELSHVVVSRFDSDGTEIGPLAEIAGLRRVNGYPHPFYTNILVDVFADSLFHLDPRTLRIRVYGSGGEVRRSFEAPPTPLDPGAAWETVLTGVADGDNPELLDYLDGVTRTDSIPHYATLLFDDEGYLWLKRFDPAVDAQWLGGWQDPPGGEWVVLDRDGSVVSSIAVPVELRPWAIRGGSVLGLYIDELGINRVRVHDIVR